MCVYVCVCIYIFLVLILANYTPCKINSMIIFFILFPCQPVYLYPYIMFFLPLFCSDSPNLFSLFLLKTVEFLNLFPKTITILCFIFSYVHFSNVILNFCAPLALVLVFIEISSNILFVNLSGYI